MNQKYVSTSPVPREAEVCAEFLHPVTDAPMVTWYQTSPFPHEEPEFFSASKKEFLTWFEPKKTP